jgi:hypothetical protein
MGFIRINNRSNFLIKLLEVYHPETRAYIDYWRMHKKRCIEGFWSVDDSNIQIDVNKPTPIIESNKWRYMPEKLYFYTNFGTILHKPEDSPKTAPKQKMRPLLRDVEWEFFYNITEARGFSGFEDDDEYTCNHSVFLQEEQLHSSCINPHTKEPKIYLKPYDYLRKLHSKPQGRALWENQAKNLFVLGSRGFGKSFSLGVGLVLHELLFDGARYYTQESIDNPFKVEVLVGAAMASKSSDLLAKTLDAYNSLPGAFGSDNDYVPSPFFKQFTGSLGPNNTKNPWKHEYEKKIGSQWVTQGSGSNLKHAIFTIENPEAAAGTRPGIILVEETGLLPNLLTVHGSNTATQMEGNTKFGSSFYIGTGGNMEKIVESQVIFYDPDGFDFVAFDNEYEEDNRKIGFFVPAYYALNQYKDDNGNTNVEAAKSYLLKVREKKKRSKDSSALDLEMMNYPIVPSEMFLNKKGNIFPTALLRDRQVEIETDTKYENALYIGKLKINSDTGKVEWLLDPNVRFIKKFPLTKDDEVNKEGGLVIYNHPVSDEQGDILYGRYIAGCDPYDHDDAGTGSLGATLVYDRFTNQIVAEYTGRPQTAREYYENVRKLLIYYNAKLLYENERKGIYDYFESKHSVYLLQEQPEIIKDVLQNSRVNRSYGMHMNNALKRYGEELIKTWLLSPHDDGDSEILNTHKLRCLPLIQELVSYNPQGNYDRVMAFMMLMYFIQETRKIELDSTKVSSNNSISSSSFFNRSLFQKTKRL